MITFPILILHQQIYLIAPLSSSHITLYAVSYILLLHNKNFIIINLLLRFNMHKTWYKK